MKKIKLILICNERMTITYIKEETLGQRIIAAWIRMGMTQEELAAEMLRLFSSMNERTKEIMLIQMRALVSAKR